MYLIPAGSLLLENSNSKMFIRHTIRLQIDIHEIHTIYKIYVAKYRNPRHSDEVHCHGISI